MASSQSLIDQAYEEFCQECEAGRVVSVGAYLDRYPAIRSSLGRLLEMHRDIVGQLLDERRDVRWPGVGELFQGFRLERLVGTGAFSRVYLGSQPALGNRRVALKLTRRGESEAYTLGRVSHPNITPVFSIGRDETTGLSVLCMPYLGSATLCSLLDGVLGAAEQPRRAALILDTARDVVAPLATDLPAPAFEADAPFEHAVRVLFAGLCEALSALHRNGVIHRDLKPSNVLLRPNGTPVLLDFNLADDAEQPGSRLGGTFQYMAPEQLDAMTPGPGSPASIDHRADLFSIGVMLWQVLTGTHPFGPLPTDLSGRDLQEELRRRHRQGFRPEVPHGWSVSPDLVELIGHCLAAVPEDRIASAHELQRRLLPSRPSRRISRGMSLILAVTLIGSIFAYRTLSSGHAEMDADSAYAAGVKAFRSGDLTTATARFGQAIARSPDAPRPWLARALTRTIAQERIDPNQRDFAEALWDVEQARNSITGEALAVANALSGYLRQRKGDHFSAERLYLRARDEGWPDLRRGPESVAFLNNLACAISLNSPMLDTQRERWQSAVGHLDELLDRRNFASSTVSLNRGLISSDLALLALNRRDEAEVAIWGTRSIRDLETAVQLSPNSGELFFRLGKATLFFADGDRAGQSISCFRKALEGGVHRSRLETLGLMTKPLHDHPCFSDLEPPVPVLFDHVPLVRLLPLFDDLPTCMK